MTTKIQLRRAIDGGMEDVVPVTSEECVMLEDGKKLKEVIDFVTTTEDFVDEDIVVEENLVDRVESIEGRIDSEFEQQNSQIATGLSNIKTIEQNIGKKVDDEVAKVNAQLSEIANKGTTVEVIERATKEEIDRQIADGTIANLTIQNNSVTIDRINSDFIDDFSISRTIDYDKWEIGSISSSNGQNLTLNKNRIRTQGYLENVNYVKYIGDQNYKYVVMQYDENKTF